jgi:hypothetical protein
MYSIHVCQNRVAYPLKLSNQRKKCVGGQLNAAYRFCQKGVTHCTMYSVHGRPNSGEIFIQKSSTILSTFGAMGTEIKLLVQKYKKNGWAFEMTS